MIRPFHNVPPIVQIIVPPAKRRLALVIGNGQYIAEKDVLTNPPNDAAGMAAALTRIGFFGVKADGDDFTVDFTSPGVTALVDLDQKRLGRALAALARAADGVRQAVVYYAGHGIEVGGENYLIPIDARLAHIRDAEFETQPLTRALRTIEGATGLRLVILDACRNNPFRARLFGNRDASGGLRGIEPPGNVLVAYAAKHGTFASDGKKGANSPFAAALLSHIEKPGLEVVELFREVKDDVLDATSGTQEPYLYGSLGRRREYFVSPAAEETVPPAPTQSLEPLVHQPVDDRTLEHTYWQSVKDTTDPAELIAFLEKFPAGTFAALAFERGKTAIDAVSSANVLRRLIGRYPDSNLASRVRRRLAEIEWTRLGKSRDAAALDAFATEVAGTPQAEHARLRAARLREPRKGAGTSRWLIGVCGAAALLAVGWVLIGINFPSEFSGTAPPPPPPQATENAPKAVAKVETPQAAEPPPAGRCAGVRAEVVGKGTVCLDPADQSRREFQDCRAGLCGPQMVVLPTGDYMMGSPESEAGREKDEGPQRKVTIRYHLAVAKFEATFAEWEACVDDGGCTHKPKAHWGRGRQPVMNVSWDDITKQYLPWLNRKLGLSGANAYRLLNEAEWEYAARGVTSASARHTAFSFGDTISTDQANYNGNYTYSSGSKGENRGKTIEVGSLNNPNAFGLHDMHGNVYEWVRDCYKAAPADGKQAPDTASCRRMLRGGSWGSGPGDLRSAFRYRLSSDYWDVSFGFRVGRTVSR